MDIRNFFAKSKSETLGTSTTKNCATSNIATDCDGDNNEGANNLASMTKTSLNSKTSNSSFNPFDKTNFANNDNTIIIDSETITNDKLPTTKHMCSNATEHHIAGSGPEAKKRKITAYEKFNWIVKQDDGLYCKLCVQFKCSNTVSGGTWVSKPFTRLKDLTERCALHQKSSSHLLAAEKSAQNLISKSSVSERIEQFATEQFVSDKDIMCKLIDSAYFLFKNEIPHTSNWSNLCRLISRADMSGRIKLFIEGRPRNATYLSTTAITDILQATSCVVDEITINNVKSSINDFNYFAIMADEGTNIKCEEVISCCVRFISAANKCVEEKFLFCAKVGSTDSVTIKDVICEQFKSRAINLDSVVALSFDGGSNFSGSKKGVQALLKEQNCPHAVYIHCRSHCLQLALQRSATNVLPIKRIFSALGDLFNLFSRSAKRCEILRNVQIALQIKTLKLVQPSATRWLAYEQCVTQILKIYPAVLSTLEQLHVDGGDLSSTAGGLLLVFRLETTIRTLCVLGDLLKCLSKLSCFFQSVQGDMSSAVKMTQATIEYVRDYDFHDPAKGNEVIKLCDDKGVVIVRETVELEHLQKFKDLLLADLQRRFSNDNMTYFEVYKYFDPNFDGLLPNLLSVCLPFHNVVNVSELNDETNLFRRWVLMNKQKSAKDLFGDLVFGSEGIIFPMFKRLAVIYMLLPLGTASVERSFSTINRILCEQRNKLLNKHYDALIRISEEGPEIPNQEFLELVFKKWNSLASRRL